MKEVGADVDVEKVWSGSFSLPFFFSTVLPPLFIFLKESLRQQNIEHPGDLIKDEILVSRCISKF